MGNGASKTRAGAAAADAAASDAAPSWPPQRITDYTPTHRDSVYGFTVRGGVVRKKNAAGTKAKDDDDGGSNSNPPVVRPAVTIGDPNCPVGCKYAGKVLLIVNVASS